MIEGVSGAAKTKGTHVSALLRVESLTKYYEVRDGLRNAKLRALNEVSFALHEGEAVALVGESGSGKSTVAKLLARLEQPSSGRMIFEGRDLVAEEPKRASLAYRAAVQMIFQDPFGSLNPVHRVAHHIERPLLRHGRVKDKGALHAQVIELLETVGLTPAEEFAQKFPHECSGGQRQRVAIARALAVEPKLILADEPTSMLDVSLRIGVLNLMRELKQQRGIAYLFITHDLASASYFADRILVMYAGTVVESIGASNLRHGGKHPYTRLLLSAVPDPRSSIEAPLAGKSGVPPVVNPPPGCPFADRCPSVQDSCRRSMPVLAEAAPGHLVRCPIVAPSGG